ncbi:hypothetical protein AB3662_17235 [Sorangium cellulosum]|uniref:hypothetical protein n=1 Tax=Sorangium cellulosum TaxID=56 RepID=UPI003D9A6DED
MRYLYAAAAVCVGVLGPGCVVEEDAATCEECGEADSALSAGAAAALGFETLSGWTASAGSLSLSTTRSEGSSALSVANAAFTVIQSAPLEITEPIKSVVSLDVRVPAQQPNPWWAGEVTLAVQAPSKNVWQSLGTRPLTGLAQGTFHRLAFDVPPAVQQALSGGASDLSFSISLNVPSGSGPHLLDRLDAVNVAPQIQADVTAAVVTNASGAAPVKGDPLKITLTVTNPGATSGTVVLRPLLTSARFNDFTGVSAGTVSVALAAGATQQVTLTAGPILVDAAQAKRFALGRGDYTLAGVSVEPAGGPASVDSTFTGKNFSIGASDVIFNAVVYDQAYLNAIGYTGTAEAYLVEAFTRPSELFTPSSPGSSSGTYVLHPGGFDQMMGVHQVFHTIGGLPSNPSSGGFCEHVGAYARTALGLTRDWDIDEAGGNYTDPDHHGFDILIGLTPELGGGGACGWLGVQVSGLFGFDLSLNRSQVIAVHETGHLFGAPHCDPLQGYVMCGAELHEHYIEDDLFVWHVDSLDVMQNLWE